MSPRANENETAVPITFGTLLRWASPLGLVIGAIIGVALTWGSFNSRLTTLEARVAVNESKRESDHELLLQIVRRLDLLICRQDPSHCEAR